MWQMKTFHFKCLRGNNIVCKINIASGGWVKNIHTLDKKIPSPFRSLALSHNLLSLFLLILPGVFGKDLGPLTFLITDFLNNALAQSYKSRATVSSLWTAPGQTLRNPKLFLPLHPSPPLGLRWIDCRDFWLRVHCLKVCVINVSILPPAPKQNLDAEALL